MAKVESQKDSKSSYGKLYEECKFCQTSELLTSQSSPYGEALKTKARLMEELKNMKLTLR